MDKIFSEEAYEKMIGELFCRFPSFQKVGAGAYKPGIANMEFADQLMGHPHRRYRIVHVAGTNGKGSVSNMLASVLASSGVKVGLYTSPHILDFRERIRIVCGSSFSLISKEYVWDFIGQWKDTFDHLDMSFFEITTLLALNWFADQGVETVVLETGLGGRLDSTNIVTPVLSVITNIGLDHCDMLGGTLPEIAFEKAGIIKPKVPVVVGESHPETDPVFERKVLYTNLPEPQYMGSRTAIMSLLTFADKVEPGLWDRHEEILSGMDLQGEYQRKNLRTVLAALDIFVKLESGTLLTPQAPSHSVGPDRSCCRRLFAAKVRWTVCPVAHDPYPGVGKCLFRHSDSRIIEAIVNAAQRTGFRGRWEKICDNPLTICDIGHNEHGLKYNFAQLESMKADGRCTDLLIVYGSVADKDVDSVIHLMPADAAYIFTQAHGKRALDASRIYERYMDHCAASGTVPGEVRVEKEVGAAVDTARAMAAEIMAANPEAKPMIYIGGSTYVVSEAISHYL